MYIYKIQINVVNFALSRTFFKEVNNDGAFHAPVDNQYDPVSSVSFFFERLNVFPFLYLFHLGSL